jgi:transposase
MAKRATPVERDERRRKVAILLIAGVTTNNIAETVAVNRKTVLLDAKATRAEWAAARIEAYDRYAAEQLVILAEVQRANWEATMRGDTKASTTVLRVCDQRARLLGLYAPRPA